MHIRTPKSLHYPITVTELLKKPKDEVEKFQPLFSYVYKSSVTEGNEYGEEFTVEKTFPARFESETDGVLVTWKIAKGTVIQSAGVDLAEIEEPCRHEIQFGGMCANCGKDMTTADFATSRPDTARASINMAHGNTALRISQDEAARVEQEAKRRLLKSRKLSLVVDLDQTIIHATVDPTVAEWQDDLTNPNYEAVKDVRKFQLVDDQPSRGCWYYIKLRPGLQKFLENISKIYELHIYTMGTRAYAVNIAAIVDPDRKIFGDRILSRDESGSMTAKNLQRLFPVDTKMVVIIDDRGDVWNWSDNLIKVKPYDFFVGIGDINSSFLPKRDELPSDDKPAESTAQAVTTDPTTEDTQPALTSVSADSALSKQLKTMSGSDDPDSIKHKTEEQGEVIAAQLEDRPLLRKQKQLDDADQEAAAEEAATVTEQNGDAPEVPTTPAKPRHNLLQNDDTELEHLERALRSVHSTFYDQYEKSTAGTRGGRIAELKGQRSSKKRPSEDLETVPDVKEIMPDMKEQVFKDVVMVFSGVVPLGTYAKNSDLGRWAQSFGAIINMDVHKNTTHVIASKTRRTAKVQVAARNPAIKIVTTNWLFDCVSQWKRLSEEPYLIPVESKHKEVTRGVSPVFQEPPNGDLSSSEEEAGGLTDGEKGASLKLNIGDLPDVDEEQEDQAGSVSPADQVTDDQWSAMMAEIDEDLSDTEDGDTDADDDESDGSTSSVRSNKKRKRDVGGVEAVPAPSTDNEGGQQSTNGADTGSKLQQRKRRAIERTSSLTKVAQLAQGGGPATTTTTTMKETNGSTPSKARSPRPSTPASEAGSETGENAAMQAELEALLNAADTDED